MKLFNKVNTEDNQKATIKILGSGCAKCNNLEKNTRDALKHLNLDVTIGHVTDFAKIAEYGVMGTPALVVKEKVISYGKVLSKDEVIKLLEGINFNE